MTIKLSDLHLTAPARARLIEAARWAAQPSTLLMRDVAWAHSTDTEALKYAPSLSLHGVARLVTYLRRCAINELASRSSDEAYGPSPNRRRRVLDLDECAIALTLEAVALLPFDLSAFPEREDTAVTQFRRTLSEGARMLFGRVSHDLCRHGIGSGPGGDVRSRGKENTFARMLWILDTRVQVLRDAVAYAVRDPLALGTEREIVDIDDLSTAIIDFALAHAGDFVNDSPTTATTEE